MRIRNLFEPGSGLEKFGSRIRDKYPGSAALLKIIIKIRQQLHRGILLSVFLFVADFLGICLGWIGDFLVANISDLDQVYLFDRSGSTGTKPAGFESISRTLESEIQKYGFAWILSSLTISYGFGSCPHETICANFLVFRRFQSIKVVSIANAATCQRNCKVG
jgi:hypothetical protein